MCHNVMSHGLPMWLHIGIKLRDFYELIKDLLLSNVVKNIRVVVLNDGLQK